MRACKRIRAPNFTMEERGILMQIIGKYKHILDNCRTDHASIQRRQEMWQQVAAEFKVSAASDRNWRCLKTAYDNIKKKIKKEMTSSCTDGTKDGGFEDSNQMPLNVVWDIGEQSQQLPTCTSTNINQSIKIEKETDDEEYKQDPAEESENPGLIEHASSIPLVQWENWQMMHQSQSGSSNHIGVEPVDCIQLSPSQSTVQSTNNAPRTNNSAKSPNTNLTNRTRWKTRKMPLYRRVAMDKRGKNLVELALFKRRYYQRLLEIAEEQHETKLRMAEMAEEEHVAKLKMLQAKTSFFLKKIGMPDVK